MCELECVKLLACPQTRACTISSGRRRAVRSLFLPNKKLPEYQIDAPNDGNDDHSQLTAIRICKYCISLLFTLGDPVTTLAGFHDWGNVHHLDIDGGNNRCGSLELSCIPISAKPLLPNPSLHFL